MTCALQKVEKVNSRDMATIATVKIMIVSIVNRIVHVNALGRISTLSRGQYKTKRKTCEDNHLIKHRICTSTNAAFFASPNKVER